MMAFWRRKPRNRRHGRRFTLLDVRLRTAPARRTRWRQATLAVLLALVVAGGLFLTGWAWQKARTELVLENPFFAVTTIEVTTEGHWITPEQVQKWIGVRKGENLLLLDLQRIRQDLGIIPQIKSESVSVVRVLPHLLRVQVSEREPIAQVQSVQIEAGQISPVVYYLDGEGWVLPPLPAGSLTTEMGRALAAMPSIQGLGGWEIRPGQRIDTPAMTNALALLAAFPKSPMAGLVDLAVIDILDPRVITVTTSQGTSVTLAHHDLAQQFRRWQTVHAHGAQKLNKSLAALDLSVTNNCPALWVETGALPPKPPKPEKPHPLRRKHV